MCDPVGIAETIERLGRPFHREVLRKKQGLTYVPGHIVIERLNSAVGVGEWSWTSKYELVGNAIIVVGQLRLLDQCLTGEDAAEIMMKRDGSGPVHDGLANALKSASTGALVRAVRLCCEGMTALYRDGAISEEQAERRDEQRRKPTPAPVKKTFPLATDKQLKALGAQIKIVGWNRDQVLAATEGVRLSEMTEQGAASLIVQLVALAAAQDKADK